MSIGKKIWVFPDAELPPEGVNVIPGHESVIVTNAGPNPACIRFTLIYENREPVCFTRKVEALRVRCFRTNRAEDFGPFTPAVGEQYAILLESDEPIVAQYGRAETREVAFYTTPGYCE